MRRVLILTSESEFYYCRPFVEAARQYADSLEVLLFDVTGFPEKYRLSVRQLCDGTITGEIEVCRIDLERDVVLREFVNIDTIHLAWYLRTGYPIVLRQSTRMEEVFVKDESARALNGLYSVAPWRWINSREAILAVENNKLYQQRIAVESGLKIPETLVSNSPSAIVDFASRDNKLLMKTFGHAYFGSDDLFCYTNIFDVDECRGLTEAISLCPVFAQRYVLKKCEYRVMVIGEKVLACRIDSQASEKTQVDWRHYDFENVAHTSCHLPEETAAGLLRFMRGVGLHYGAVDLIEEPDGRFVFLEVNPSGQWGWIEHFANLGIPAAVVEMMLAL